MMDHDQIYELIKSMSKVENHYIDQKKKTLEMAKDLDRKFLKTGLERFKEIKKEVMDIHDKIPDKASPDVKFYCLLAEERSVGIYFDDTVKYDEDMAMTGIEFMKNGLMDPPYETLFFQAKNYFSDGKSIDVWVKYIPKQKRIYYLPPPNNGEMRLSLYIDIETSKTYFFDIRSEGWPVINVTDPEVLQSIDFYSKAFFHLCMVLNHPVYYHERNEVNEAINSKRERKGKSRLSPYIYVKMNKDVKESLTNSDGTIRRPHWRRGHVRRLRSGIIVPVQACIVNYNGYVPNKKTYIVKNNLIADRRKVG